jgi:hypothetical protein
MFRDVVIQDSTPPNLTFVAGSGASPSPISSHTYSRTHSFAPPTRSLANSLSHAPTHAPPLPPHTHTNSLTHSHITSLTYVTGATVQHEAATEWVDPGVSAIDILDGNLTSRVVATVDVVPVVCNPVSEYVHTHSPLQH